MRSILVAALALAAMSATADITFDANKNTIVIENFAEGAPCTLRDLRITDEINAWGKVTRNATTDVTTVNANLQVGKLDGESGYLQIGTEENPREILVLKGDLFVAPAMVNGISKKIRENGLLIGSARDPGIGGTLRLAKDKCFYIGYLAEYAACATGGGCLSIHNGAIESAHRSERWNKKFSRISHMARVTLKNATVAGFNDAIYGFMPNRTYRNSPGDFRIEDCVFADGGAIIFGQATVSNCVFRNLQQAVLDYGALDTTLDRCIFENNERNFSIAYGRGVTCLDCRIGPAKYPDIISRAKGAQGGWIYPRFVSKRRGMRVKLLDAAGKPLSGIKVTFQADNEGSHPKAEPESSDVLAAVTGADGLTPARAFTLTEQLKQAGDYPGAMSVVDYTYTVTAAANGKKGGIVGYKPRTDDLLTINVTLDEWPPRQYDVLGSTTGPDLPISFE